jgi:hypothetical protein
VKNHNLQVCHKQVLYVDKLEICTYPNCILLAICRCGHTETQHIDGGVCENLNCMFWKYQKRFSLLDVPAAEVEFGMVLLLLQGAHSDYTPKWQELLLPHVC